MADLTRHLLVHLDERKHRDNPIWMTFYKRFRGTRFVAPGRISIPFRYLGLGMTDQSFIRIVETSGSRESVFISQVGPIRVGYNEYSWINDAYLYEFDVISQGQFRAYGELDELAVSDRFGPEVRDRVKYYRNPMDMGYRTPSDISDVKLSEISASPKKEDEDKINPKLYCVNLIKLKQDE